MKSTLNAIAVALLASASVSGSAAFITTQYQVCEGIGQAQSRKVVRAYDYSRCINWGGLEPCEPTLTTKIFTKGAGEEIIQTGLEAKTLEKSTELYSALVCIIELAWIEKIQLLPTDGTEARAWEGLFSCGQSTNLCIE